MSCPPLKVTILIFKAVIRSNKFFIQIYPFRQRFSKSYSPANIFIEVELTRPQNYS